MRIKREGEEKEVWWNWENCRQTIQKSSCLQRKANKLNCLQGNLSIFIASIYMESRKVLKERMQIVCCLCCGKGEYPEKEVVQIVEVTTRRHEGSLQAHLSCLYRKKDPQPESLGTLKPPSSSSLVGSPFHW